MNYAIKRGALAIAGLVLTVFAGSKLSQNVMTARAAAPCIVTIFGQQYDVSPLQTTHSGGNIFVCGTDMTATYQGMHGTNVARIAAYLLPAATPTPTPTPTPTASPTPTPTPTPNPTPSVTPSPSPSPTAKPGDHENEHEEEHESEQAEEHEHEHESEHSNRSGEHRQDALHRSLRSLSHE